VSRNLGQTSCHECHGGTESIVLEGPIRPVTELEDPVYFHDHEGLLIAEARCVLCHALYIAWVDWPPPHEHSHYWRLEERRSREPEARFVDLSYRRSFNDEPAVEDLPLFEVSTVLVRRPLADHRYLRHERADDVARWRARVEAARDRPITEDLALEAQVRGADPWRALDPANRDRTWVQACALHDDCRRHPEVGVVCLARRERDAR